MNTGRCLYVLFSIYKFCFLRGFMVLNLQFVFSGGFCVCRVLFSMERGDEGKQTSPAS